MKIALVQPFVKFNHPDENLASAQKLIESLEDKDIDLIVLPEMFATGTCSEPKRIVPAAKQAFDFMQFTASKHNCALCGSVAVEENSKYFNRLYFITPDADIFHYDKHHLFSFAGENENFTAGKERVIVTWRGWKLLLQVCYDLRFPIFSRNHIVHKNITPNGDNPAVLQEAEYDAAIYVASWPDSRIIVWDTLLKARAIENQCYTIGVNMAGNNSSEEKMLNYNGHSAVINYRGEIVTTCNTEGKEDMRIAELNIEKLYGFRAKFPTLPDGD